MISKGFHVLALFFIAAATWALVLKAGTEDLTFRNTWKTLKKMLGYKYG